MNLVEAVIAWQHPELRPVPAPQPPAASQPGGSARAQADCVAVRNSMGDRRDWTSVTESSTSAAVVPCRILPAQLSINQQKYWHILIY